MDIIPFHWYFLRQVSNACMIRTTQLFNKMSATFVWQTQILNCSIPIVFCFYIVSILQSFRIYCLMFFFMVISFLYPGSPSPNIQNGLKRMIYQWGKFGRLGLLGFTLLGTNISPEKSILRYVNFLEGNHIF